MNEHNCRFHRYCTNCNPEGKPAAGQTVYLELRKAQAPMTRRKNGNYIVELEASNENLDLEGQRVLQSALMKSKDYYLHNGVVSKDHLYKSKDAQGNVFYNEEFIIGEPVEVRKEPGKTVVVCELYGQNEYARKFIEMLKNDSTRVKASVGGTILEKEDAEDGENIKTVLWDDLALTIAPVNPTLSGAVLHKSISGAELVKALTAGYETDEAKMEGGRALQGDNIEKAVLRLFDTMQKGGIDKIEDITDTLLNESGIDESDVPYVIEELNRELSGMLNGVSGLNR